MEEGQRGVVLPWDDKWQVPITQKADTVVIFIFAIQYEFDVEFLFGFQMWKMAGFFPGLKEILVLRIP